MNLRALLRWLLILSGILATVMLVFFVVDRIVMPAYTRQGSEIPVPALVGLSIEQATMRADSAGFILIEEAPKLGGNVPEGLVLEQRPLAGALAKPGRKIRVVPAMAAQRDIAPDLLGLEVREAQIRCRNADLLCSGADIQYRFAAEVPKGYVIEQSPLPGDVVEPGEAITLTVSLGPRPERVYMPYLMEKQLHEARMMLRESGLQLGRIARKETDLYATGIVIAQSIRSGEEVEPGAAVDIVVAVPVPKTESELEPADSLETDSTEHSTSTGLPD